MRGDIGRVLHDRIRGEAEVRFGASVEAVDVHRYGVGVRLSDGEEVSCGLVVGADGLHSKVRALRFGPEDGFVRPLDARVAAFLLDRGEFPDAEPGTSCSMTEVGRAAALASVDGERLVAFFVWRTEGRPRRARGRRNCAPRSPGRGGMSRPCWTACRPPQTCTSMRRPRW